LGRVTVLIGPNGSGKSTAMMALKAAGAPQAYEATTLRSAGVDGALAPTLTFDWADGGSTSLSWPTGQFAGYDVAHEERIRLLRRSRVFSLESVAVARPAKLRRVFHPGPGGEDLANVLTGIQDRFPESFDEFNRELARWLPDFDRVLLDTVDDGTRVFLLRAAVGRHVIPATELSEGTLLAVALLAIAHMPDPPPIVGLEEPDRGLHPRLLRDLRDAVFRLAYPENYGQSRGRVQVVMTTHSPYMVDLFRDHPEDVVIAEKDGLWARFRRLVDLPNVDELLRDAHLGDAWYSGVLGGVPAGT
jgi:predicted ATPase